jgi:hypothetical protein
MPLRNTLTWAVSADLSDTLIACRNRFDLAIVHRPHCRGCIRSHRHTEG